MGGHAEEVMLAVQYITETSLGGLDLSRTYHIYTRTRLFPSILEGITHKSHSYPYPFIPVHALQLQEKQLYYERHLQLQSGRDDCRPEV